MTGLSYEQIEEITRLHGMNISAGVIAAQLSLDEATVRSALRQRKLRGVAGLVCIFGFFAAIIATPLLIEEHLEGDQITDPAIIRANLAGTWEGSWTSRGHKRPLQISFREDANDSWSLKVVADDELCPGNGKYSGSGSISTNGISAKLFTKNPGCGDLDINYVMALDANGDPKMKGRYLRMPTGDVGDHFLIRK